MKRITASDARRHWFQVLDRVAAGEVVMIERNGRRIVLRRAEGPKHPMAVPDYTGFTRPLADGDRADRWSWDWEETGGLRPREAGE